jgi:hypothetical protein
LKWILRSSEDPGPAEAGLIKIGVEPEIEEVVEKQVAVNTIS